MDWSFPQQAAAVISNPASHNKEFAHPSGSVLKKKICPRDLLGSSLKKPYAILSHALVELEEVSLQDFQDKAVRIQKRGFGKIQKTCEEAKKRHLKYTWVDTCCV